uniref:Uncharacterized protein n=1 Tax=Brassica oleracea TaxID=3712 RepID=A0A3P6HDX9_BRAOL|nr:unnamed protein product [Brassica oleracea]
MGRLEYYRRDYNESGSLELRRGSRSTYRVFWLFCFLAAIWHWVYWDLEIFCDERTGKTFFGFAQDFWNSFISFRSGLLWFWRISCNRIIWSWNMGIRPLWTNRKGPTRKSGVGRGGFFDPLFREE